MQPERYQPEILNAAVRVAELLGRSWATSTSRPLRRAHLDNLITHPRVQKPGLAFAGYYEYIKPGRVQIIGESETEYLKTLQRTSGWTAGHDHRPAGTGIRHHQGARRRSPASSPSARTARCRCSPRRPSPRR